MEFPHHSQQLLSALRSQRQRGFLCDCTVVVGSVQFQAHKAVLASCSPYFNMCYSDFAEGNSGSSCVTLDSDIVTSAAFGLLLDFVYEGVLQLEGAPPVEDILAAASFLHMNGVVRVCKRRLHKRGPLAEADSTRCEESSGVATTEEPRQEDAGQPSVPVNQTSAETLLLSVPRETKKSRVESVRSEDRPGCGSADVCIKALSPELADTTQPGMDVPPNEEGGNCVIKDQVISFTGAQNSLEAESEKEPSTLCSPGSTTESNSLQSFNQQPSSSSSLVPLPQLGGQTGSSLLSNTCRSKNRNASRREKEMTHSNETSGSNTCSAPQVGPPQIQIKSAVSLQGQSTNLDPTAQKGLSQAHKEDRQAPTDCQETGYHHSIAAGIGMDVDNVNVKAEAIVISDEELEDEKPESIPMMDVDEDFTDTQEGPTSPHLLSSNPLGLLQIVSVANDYTFPLSPSSSSSPQAGPSSQDALSSPPTSRQLSDNPPFFQSIHDSMGNFIKDVPTCGVCGKTFVCSYTLRRHAIVHTRARPYECCYCYRTYTQSGDLYRHIRKCHDHTLPARRSKADIEASVLQSAPTEDTNNKPRSS